MYLQPVKHSSTLPRWFYHAFLFSSPLLFPFAMPSVVPGAFRINFKILPYCTCTSHSKVWYIVIVLIVFIYCVIVCDFIFIYNILRSKCCSCCCCIFCEIGSVWILTNIELCVFPSTYQDSSVLQMGWEAWSHSFLLFLTVEIRLSTFINFFPVLEAAHEKLQYCGALLAGLMLLAK